MTRLTDRKCEPCEGGVAPLNKDEATALMKELDDAWTLDDDGGAIEREFKFPAFSRTMSFVNAVAFVATNEGHHPEVVFSYGFCPGPLLDACNRRTVCQRFHLRGQDRRARGRNVN